MGSRFFVTGVQIAMILVSLKNKEEGEVLKIIDEIETKQYICEKEEFNKIFKDKKQ